MPGEVALVVAAHPDDEALGAAILLAENPAACVCYLTDGAAAPESAVGALADREAYARARRAEGRRALELAGVPPDRVFELDGTDQRAALELTALTTRLGALMGRLGVTALVTHPYEGGHPDHDAAALCAHAAAALVARERRPPSLVEFTSYHGGAGEHWTRGAFLHPNHAIAGPCPPSRARALTDDQRRLKRRMMACYESQARVLEAFPVEQEITRQAPRYRFAEAPHGGPLLYERHDWGMTGPRWRALAAEALAALGLDPQAEL